MKLSSKQENEIKAWEYFIPKNCNWAERTDEDIKKFFEWSEQGKHKDLLSIPTYEPEGRTYFHALVHGKKRAGVNIHEIYEESFNAHDGSWVGYDNLFESMPSEVVSYIKKEIFKGEDFKPRVYDCFMLFNELDLLEIRLNLLDPYVDFFVIGEGAETFSGGEKLLYYRLNEERFSKWKDKIIYIVIPRPMKFDSSFERAAYQKNLLRRNLPFYGVKDEDTVYFGDLDEIWKPQDIKDDKVYNLEQLNYCYYLNQRSSERWVGTIVGKWKTIKNNTFSFWRANHTNEISNAGWHFTNMGGVEQIKKKLAAYDHQEMNTEINNSLLEERIENGEDYVGRRRDWEGKPFEFYVDDTDLPSYIIDNKSKYNVYFK